MKKLFIIVPMLCLLFSSCGNMSDQDIEKTTSSGVVLVQNKSYYEVVLSNGESVFFSSFDNEGDLDGFTVEKDSVKSVTSYGTGFFVSETGEIATNAHVVSNTISDKDVNKSIGEVISALKKLAVYAYSEYEAKLDSA